MTINEVHGMEALADLGQVSDTYAESDVEAARQRKALKDELQECGDNRRVFVACEKHVPVAFIELVLNSADNDPELANGKDVAHVHNLQVHKDVQGQGIGTRMMEYVEAIARETGMTKLTLGVDSNNHRARRLYEHLGWLHMKDVKGPSPEQDGMYLYKNLDPLK